MTADMQLGFGAWLRRRRRELDLTQAQLARQLGYSTIALRKIEADERRPSPEVIERLADRLAIPAAERPAFLRFARGEALPPPQPLASPSEVPWQPAWQPTRRGHIPAPLTPLIGRADVAAAIRHHLLQTGTRLISLVGPAGVGKTRLSLHVATELSRAQAFADGVFFVPLASIRNPAAVVPAIAQTLDVLADTGEPPGELLAALLRQRRVLLVLDNFEQVTAAAAALVDLLRDCPEVSVLVTTRIPLQAYGERIFPVPPLALPDATASRAPAALVSYSAVALFVARAQAAQPEFALTADNAGAVSAVCRQLDGLPLAIELAAAQVGWLPPAQLLPHLTGRFALAVRGPRGLPERHETLHNAISWSYDLLAPPQQAAFDRLSVFSGGCTVAAALAVAGAGTEDLRALVHSGLVQQVAVEDSEPRCTLLETIHQYAAARLAERPELSQVRRQHGLYFLDLAETAEPHLLAPDQLHWLGLLELEHDNVRIALAWAIELGEAELAIRLCAAVWRFWHIRGHWHEGRRWLAQALELPGVGEPNLRARALTAAGALAGSQSDYEAASGYLEASLALRRQTGNAEGVISSLNNLGLLARHQGDHARALALHQESLELAQQADSPVDMFRALNSLGLVAIAQREFGRAHEYLEASLVLCRPLGNRHSEAGSLEALGEAALGLEQFEQAAGHFAASLRLSRTLADMAGVCANLLGLAVVVAARRQAVVAARLVGATEALLESKRLTVKSINQPLYEQARRLSHARLTDAAFFEAAAEGRAMATSDWHEAVDYALEAFR